MKTRLSFLILVFEILNCLVCYGGNPVARIGSNVDEIAAIEPGDPLEFTADAMTEKERCRWKVIPSVTQSGKPTFKVMPDKKTMVLFSRTGTYLVTLYVWDEDMAEVTRTVTVGKPTVVINPPPQKPMDPPIPRPNDSPQPPPEPQPVPLGLSEVVKNSVKANVPATERSVALKIADAYKEGAKNLANGIWTVDKAIANQRDLNTKIPGYKADVWRPVFKDIADVLAKARDEDKFSTQKQYVAVWAELSLAFFGANE